VFAVEDFAAVWDEVMTLARRHWNETELYRGEELNPRKDVYLQAAAAGTYILFTVRINGTLVGYTGMYLHPSMHTNRLFAHEDFWFLGAEHRKGMLVIRFYKFIERHLRARGAESCWMSAKTASGVGKILKWLGYSHRSDVYVKKFEA
jgi:hypothetical protein